MAFNDSLSDMLARIKNAHKANKTSTSCFKSKLNLNVLSVLKDEGYIRDYKDVELRKGINNIQIELKYHNLIQDYEQLEQKLDKINKQKKVEEKKETEFSEKIDELNQETDTLLEEMDKWQI